MGLHRTLVLNLFYLLTSVGFFYQTGNILANYLEYQTLTRMTVGIPKDIHLPDLSVCIKVSDVFDYDSYNQDYNTTLKNVNESNFDPTTVLIRSVNLNALFNYTPDIISYVTKCRFRQPQALDYKVLDSSNCKKCFTIRKYFLQEYMCYWIRLSRFENSTYAYDDIAYADDLQGMFYTISFSGEQINRTSFMRLFLHPVFADEPDDYPDTTTAYSVGVFRSFNDSTGMYANNYYTLTYNSLINSLLPYPYHPSCIDYKIKGFDYRSDCFKACLNNLTIRRFNKMPFSMIIPKPSTLKVISGYDVVNETRSAELYAMNVKCNRLCEDEDCVTITMLTELRASKFSADMLTFRVNIPKKPNVVVQFIPLITLTDFIIYLFSCISTWYGISVIDSWKILNYFQKGEITGTTDGRKLLKQPGGVVKSRCRNRIELELTEIKQNLSSKDCELFRTIRDLRNLELSVASTCIKNGLK